MNEEKINFGWDKINYSLLSFFIMALTVGGFCLTAYVYNTTVFLISCFGVYLLALIFWDREEKYE